MIRFTHNILSLRQRWTASHSLSLACLYPGSGTPLGGPSLGGTQKIPGGPISLPGSCLGLGLTNSDVGPSLKTSGDPLYTQYPISTSEVDSFSQSITCLAIPGDLGPPLGTLFGGTQKIPAFPLARIISRRRLNHFGRWTPR